jgi:hypothetical protein
VIIILDPFLSFMVYFQQCKIQHVGNVVRFKIKKVGVVHSIGWEGNNITNYK